ncbi:MAG: hypothetical protein WC457_03110 [Patescibacteria group bacterium]
MKLLPTLTTLVKDEWRNKINEIDALGLKEIALFPTAIEHDERQELYKLLEKTDLQKIPFVHLREEDMDENEIKYFVERWGAEIFNIHPDRGEGRNESLSKYRDQIYVENIWDLKENDLSGFAGICLDFSHLENARLTNEENYKQVVATIEKGKVGCAHIAAIYLKPVEKIWHGLKQTVGRLDYHHAESNERFNYLKNYPREMFPSIAAIEVENPLSEQLRFRDYIIDLLKL